MSGSICCYTSLTMCKDPLIGSRGAGELLCCRSQSCFNTTDLKTPLPVGMLPKDNGVICGLGLYCCTTSLIKPTVLVAGESTACCAHSAASFPFDPKYVKSPICAIYGLRIMPGPIGCCLPTPEGFKAAGAGGGAAPAAPTVPAPATAIVR